MERQDLSQRFSVDARKRDAGDGDQRRRKQASVGLPDRHAPWSMYAKDVTDKVYGFSPHPSDPGPSISPPIALSTTAEDWIWVSDWAGAVSGLVDLVENDSTYGEVRLRATSSLELLQSTVPGGILPLLLDQPKALAQLFHHAPDSSLCDALLSSKDHILHLNLKPHIPPGHMLYDLIHAPAGEKRKEAWRAIDQGRPALSILSRGTRAGEDLLFVSHGYEESNLSRLLALASEWSQDESEESRKCLELALDVLQAAPQSDPLLEKQLALILPRLVLISRARGSSRSIGLPTSLGREVAQSLLRHSTKLINGRSAFPTAVSLVQPYLASLDPSDPLYRIFSSSATTPALSPFPDTRDGRALSRLEAALTSSIRLTPPSPSSLVHAVTTADLLSIIAPSYLRTLASAPVPPLDIPSSIPDFTPDSQASAWAGKVYSEHQFRTRENVGLGIAGVAGQGSRASRPASRHVDEYVR